MKYVRTAAIAEQDGRRAGSEAAGGWNSQRSLIDADDTVKSIGARQRDGAAEFFCQTDAASQDGTNRSLPNDKGAGSGERSSATAGDTAVDQNQLVNALRVRAQRQSRAPGEVHVGRVVDQITATQRERAAAQRNCARARSQSARGDADAVRFDQIDSRVAAGRSRHRRPRQTQEVRGRTDAVRSGVQRNVIASDVRARVVAGGDGSGARRRERNIAAAASV